MKINPTSNNYQQIIENNKKPELIKKTQLKKTILTPNTNTYNENDKTTEILSNEVKESTRKEKV